MLFRPKAPPLPILLLHAIRALNNDRLLHLVVDRLLAFKISALHRGIGHHAVIVEELIHMGSVQLIKSHVIVVEKRDISPTCAVREARRIHLKIRQPVHVASPSSKQ